jgi:hypothetical protein
MQRKHYINIGMYKYAIVENLESSKTFLRIFSPWIKKGAKIYKDITQVPKEYILVTSRQSWVEPTNTWHKNGNKFIEIEYGYWGERMPVNKPRIQTRRVTFCGSHNSNMKSSVPFSRLSTLTNPKIQPWKTIRGEYLLIVEPSPEWVFERSGISIGQWRDKMINTISPYWSGAVKWRQKRGGANPTRFQTFISDIENSYAVVGERTMACVEAVMLGHPAYTIDITAVTPLMGNDLSILKNLEFPDRTQWLEHIAWSQFHLEEFKNGTYVADLVEEYQIK